jgi:hypothetical protein
VEGDTIASRRTLRLRRETLTDLTDRDLRDVAAGDHPTWYSCLDYISCYWWQCVESRYICTE